jgi:hypothetical protein
MPAWVVVLVVLWLLAGLACLEMGRETGRNGALFAVAGPVGVVLLALLHSRKPPSATVARLEKRGLIGLRIRRETLEPGGGGNLDHLMGGAQRQISEDVSDGVGD